MTWAVLGLGANLGDPRAALGTAVRALMESPGIQVEAVSGLWRTAAIGGPPQDAFLNGVTLVETTLIPDQLLALGHEIEARSRRERTVRWGPRTLDIDLLDVSGFRCTEAELTVPHPRAQLRGFVLAPWSQIDPGWILTPASGVGVTVGELWTRWYADHGSDPEQSVVHISDGAWWE